jgi:hypothetical protein
MEAPQWAVLEAALGKVEKAIRETGKDPLDGECIIRRQETLCANLAGAVEKILNAPPSGEAIEDKAEIARFLVKLTDPQLNAVVAAVRGVNSLSTLERKR